MPYGYDFNVTPVQVENGTDYQARKDSAALRKIQLQQAKADADESNRVRTTQANQRAAATNAYQPQSFTSNPGAISLQGAQPPTSARAAWSKRADGSDKGDGFLGILKRPDGGISSEISVSTDEFGGKEFPLLVPTLAPDEVKYLLNTDVSNGKIPPAIIQKAAAFARQRQAQGLPLFAQPGEQDESAHPDFERASMPSQQPSGLRQEYQDPSQIQVPQQSYNLPGYGSQVQGPSQFNRGSYLGALQKSDPYGAMQAQQGFETQDIEHQKQMAMLSEQLGKASGEQLKNLGTSLDLQARYFQAVDSAPPQMQPQIYAQARQHAIQAGVPGAEQTPEQFDPQAWQVMKSQFMDVKQAADLANKRIDQNITMRGQDMTAQTAAAGQKVTMRGQNMTDARAREANQVAAGPGSQVTGDAFLQTLPAGTQAQVKAIAEGRMPLPNARSKQGMAMANAVAQAYPGFDSSKQPAYAATRKTFTSGTVADGINSFNTALNHLGRAYDNLPNNLPVELLNAPFNWVKNQTGSDQKFNRFNSDLTAVTSEVAKAYKKGVITEDERNDWLARLNPNSPTGKLKDNLGEIGQLLMGKLDAYQHQWDEAMPMGAVAPVNIVSKEAKTAFDKITGQSGGKEIHYKIVNGQLVPE